jgi:hypothetical protein
MNNLIDETVSLKNTQELMNLKDKYENIRYYYIDDTKYHIGRQSIHCLEWIDNFLHEYNFNKTFVSLETCDIYNEIMITLKEITIKYFQIKDSIYYENKQYLYNPNEFFDEVIKNRHNLWFKNKDEAEKLLFAFEYMIYTIVNYLDELDFDIRQLVGANNNIENDDIIYDATYEG